MASSSLFISRLLIFLCLVSSASALAPAAAAKTSSCRYQQQHHELQQLQPFRRGHYTFFPNAPHWNRKLGQTPRTLTYALSPVHSYGRLGREKILVALRGAVGRWAAVIPLRFQETPDYEEADIKVGFYKGEHGHATRFDGRGKILAYAYPMSETHGTYVNIDAAERWTTDLGKDRNRQAMDLESVLVHELGHVLGLGHTTTASAVMYPILAWRERKVELDEEDIQGVQELFRLQPSISWKTATMEEVIVNCDKFRRCGLLWSIVAAAMLAFATFWFAVWWCIRIHFREPKKKSKRKRRQQQEDDGVQERKKQKMSF